MAFSKYPSFTYFKILGQEKMVKGGKLEKKSQKEFSWFVVPVGAATGGILQRGWGGGGGGGWGRKVGPPASQ